MNSLKMPASWSIIDNTRKHLADALYSRAFTSEGSISSIQPTTAENIWLKKIPEGSKMQNLNLQRAGNNLHSITLY